MTVDLQDTIVAIASAEGPGLRGIVRATGPQCIDVIQALTRLELQSDRSSRHDIQLDVGIDSDNTEQLAGQLLVWPNEQSYTRQPSVEFHTLGSRPILDLVVQRFLSAGCRVARPGEFTLRAFLGGRLDLTQAEAVLGLIDANGQEQFQVALRQLAGGLASPLETARNQLIDLLAELEAGLDFVEEDIEFVTREQTLAAIESVTETVGSIRNQIHSREVANEVHKVALVGLPNVGKSSLFNAMIGVEHAIVADIAGTTRDFVTHQIETRGIQLQLVDTAGIDRSDSLREIEQSAQTATAKKSQSASLRLFCLDSSRPTTDQEEERISRYATDSNTIFVLTKCDLKTQIRFPHSHILTSTIGAEPVGLESLRDEIARRISSSQDSNPAVLGSTLIRCREQLDLVHQGLDAAQGVAKANAGEELIAAELRIALDHLGQIVGTVYTDDILDRIFGRFCIGK